MYALFFFSKGNCYKICSLEMYKFCQEAVCQYLKECPFFDQLEIDRTVLDTEYRLRGGGGIEKYDWIILCWSVSYHNIIDG